MFDLSWGEMMLIGAVALIVIGPKDLPRTLRAVGQGVGKIKRMASEFQGQFNQAMREAELDQVRKEVEGINRAAQVGLNPAKAARDELKRAVEGSPKPAAAAAAKTATSATGATAVTTDQAGPSLEKAPALAEAPRGPTLDKKPALATDDPGAVASPAPVPGTPVPPAPEPVHAGETEGAKP